MRRVIAFPCAGEQLVGTLDAGEATTGLLIVSGGNEVRIGAHRGMALLAVRLAAGGTPVFRFDRRGIGDSSGENRGFAGSADDIGAAATTFRAEAPQLTRIVAFGNCDAATALALFHQAAGLDVLVLANPWLADETDALPPAAAIRARYAERLKDPREWLRALRGGVDFRKLLSGLRKSVAGQPEPEELATTLRDALAQATIPVTILLAERDNTAIAFRAGCTVPNRVTVRSLASASHSFAREGDGAWLEDALRQALA